MPGKKWTEQELEILLNAKLTGLSSKKIIDLLPGGTVHSIAQIVRRNQWADKTLSQKMKDAVVLTGERHQLFVEFLKKNSNAPIEQIANSWNAWAGSNNMPTIKAGRVYYWIEKLGLPHSRSDAWYSSYAKRKRRQKRNQAYLEKINELQNEVSLELIRLQSLQLAAITRLKKIRNVKKIERIICGCCENSWLLSETFFQNYRTVLAFMANGLIIFKLVFVCFVIGG